MMNRTVDASQQKAARVAGFTYLFFVIASIVHYNIVELNLIVSENTSAITNFIKSNELLFRVSIVGHLIVFISCIILSLAFYRILESVNKNLVLLAIVLILIKITLAIVIELSSFMALFLAKSKDYLTVFGREQLQALLGLFLNTRDAGYSILTLFFNLGLMIFFYVFFKSKYIPRILAGFGIFSCLLLFIYALVKILAPNLNTIIPIICWAAPNMLFEIIIGLWLLLKGVNIQPQDVRASWSVKTDINETK